tara:strand:+ start:141 stop:521 length:381 start_codon:yes stop_codon:yes gene_type:complete
MPLPIAAGVLAARIAAHIAKSPTARKGLASAFKKFGKDTVKKEANKIPQIVRGRKAAASKKAGEKTRQKSKELDKSRKGTTPGSRPGTQAKQRAGSAAAKTRKKNIAQGKKPDRSSTLGRRGYNFP